MNIFGIISIALGQFMNEVSQNNIGFHRRRVLYFGFILTPWAHTVLALRYRTFSMCDWHTLQSVSKGTVWDPHHLRLHIHIQNCTYRGKVVVFVLEMRDEVKWDEWLGMMSAGVYLWSLSLLMVFSSCVLAYLYLGEFL